MHPKSFYTFILILGCCACLGVSAQQPDIPASEQPAPPPPSERPDAAPSVQPDPTAPEKDYSYGVLTLLTGIGVLPTGNNNGTLDVSFPYSFDGGPDTIYNSGGIRPYARSKVFVFPLAYETGNLREFFKMGAAFSVIGKSTGGYNFFFGYGRNFYLGFRHSQAIEDKAIVIKPSISLSYTRDVGNNSDASLGSIDNTGHAVNVLGYTAGQTFDVQNPADPNDPNSVATTSTEDATSLDIAYVQREWALMPKITITNNQYKKGPHFEFTVGYNLPFYERGGISLSQSDGSDDHNSIARIVDLGRGGLNTTYNGQPVTSSPFRFSGFFWNLTVAIRVYYHANKAS